MRREIVEDKETGGVEEGEGEGPPSREEGRKCSVFLKEGMVRSKSEGRQIN